MAEEIEFPFGGTVKPEEWGDKAFVYAIDGDIFSITQEKHPALELKSDRKFEAKVAIKDGDVHVSLPLDFARFYLWKRKAVLMAVEYDKKKAIVVFARHPEMSPVPSKA